VGAKAIAIAGADGPTETVVGAWLCSRSCGPARGIVRRIAPLAVVFVVDRAVGHEATVDRAAAGCQMRANAVVADVLGPTVRIGSTFGSVGNVGPCAVCLAAVADETTFACWVQSVVCEEGLVDPTMVGWKHNVDGDGL